MLDYGGMLGRLRAVVKNRSSLASQKQQLLGEVEEHHHCDAEAWAEDIDAVGASVQCHNCEGWGHYARECPTTGKDKGAAKGGGKSSSEGQWSPKGGKGGQGKSLGYKGTCYKCGDVEHMAFECNSDSNGAATARRAYAVLEVEEGEPAEV